MVVYRSAIFTPLADPFPSTELEGTYRHLDDGYLVVDDRGSIAGVGPWDSLPDHHRDHPVVRLSPDRLISPGFVDAHLHGPQLEMIGSYGGHLLEWLNRYTFPTEMKFADPEYARNVSAGLFDELLRNGTLLTLVFSTSHTEATNVLFEEAERRGMRAIIGKAMMDRNAPAGLIESTEDSYRGTLELLKRWGHHEILRYAISPRFAPTATQKLLHLAGELRQEFPEAYVHTHVSENLSEVFWVKQLFPDAENYVDVYDQAGLLGERTILAHGVHLSDEELRTVAESKTRICHCPNSNLFLGSGLFPLKSVLRAGITVALGSDIGAGTTPSMLNAMADAYKVQQVQGISLSPFHLWYLATLGGARALSLGDTTGSIEEGKEADFIVLDLSATPLLRRRIASAGALEDMLAALIFIGDDRVVDRAFVRGREVYARG
ncbi:MAG TPA: guanine deaminase [Thermoanaerobaculia bacterium]|nr:guanine deaminase [Thermoanaerobaculia bacterium]